MTDDSKPTNVIPLRRAAESEPDDDVELLMRHIRAELVRRAHASADAIEAMMLEAEAGESGHER